MVFSLTSILTNIGTLCRKHAWKTFGFFALLAALSCAYTVTHLGITTETDRLFSDSLPWKQKISEVEHLFPGEKGTLVAVIRGKTPEEAQDAAKQLADKLSQDTVHFSSVSLPNANPYYLDRALLFLDETQLQSLLDSLVSSQAFLGTLAADPSARGLFGSFTLMGKGIEAGEDIPADFNKPLNGLAEALTQNAKGDYTPLSWQKLLLSDLDALAAGPEFVLTHPKRDFNSLQPSQASTTAMRTAFNDLKLAKDGRVNLLITGEAKINDEEFATVADGMTISLVLSIVLVSLWLFLAVKSPRIVFPVLITLIFGLILTTGFASISVGTLNLISVAFAVLFVGIAVDFAIQYSVRFRSQKDMNAGEAIDQTSKECGIQILVAALATAAGFLAFTFTSFVGVAQLGIIAGVGMLIAFICTIALLPALLIIFKAHPDKAETGFAFMHPVDHKIRKYRAIVLGIFGILALLGIGLLYFLKFDSDPLHTKNPNTEGMQVLHILEENPFTTPYNAQLLVSNFKEAASKAKQFSQLAKDPNSTIHDVLWLGAIVPEHQKEKLDIIEDSSDLILPTLDAINNPEPAPNAEELRKAAKKAAEELNSVKDKLSEPLLKLQAAMNVLSEAPDDVLIKTNNALTYYLTPQLTKLLRILQPKETTIADIPKDLRREYVSPDGRYLLIIHPKGHMSDSSVLRRFVDQVKSVDPNIAGPALEITESANTIVKAFITAAFAAIVMIFIILFINLRRLLDVCLVLAPLILSALLTVIIDVSIPEPLNYANVIALPLLLGVGVSFNIYFVMNWRAGLSDPLSSPTARAVLFSALTTGCAFGSLALSAHPGTASMGRLLLFSLAATLICTLVFIPALLPNHKAEPLIKE
ncbi:RND transporter [Acetobacteraceae bacterium]|nr:RND transporter [Acetobacteraceae bacterium]